jgi:Putative lumazine-binding
MRTKTLKPPATAILVAALSAILLAACGSTISTGSYKGPSKAVAQRISDFQSDVAGSEEGKLCSRDLASAVQTRLRAAGGNCVQALEKQLGAIDDFEISIASIAVHGTSATARVKSTWSGKQRTTTMQLVKEGSSWKIAALG